MQADLDAMPRELGAKLNLTSGADLRFGYCDERRVLAAVALLPLSHDVTVAIFSAWKALQR